jgi:hypothetical protein
MELSHLRKLFAEARKLTQQSEFVVIGSLSILGVVRESKEIPARMLMSIDVDCYCKRDPGRTLDLSKMLGEGSQFEAENGYYLDPVSPDVATLPEQWEFRLIPLRLEDGIVLFFLDPNDAAVSKYARGDVRDREWLTAGLEAGLLSAPVIEARFRTTPFLDEAESQRAHKALSEDRAAIRKPARPRRRS